RHSGPPPARTQLTARKQATDYVGGPSRNFEASVRNLLELGKKAAVPVLLSAVVSVAAGASPASAEPGSKPTSAMTTGTPFLEQSRQLLGQVATNGPTYFEASAQTEGTYAIEYDIDGTAFYNTYVNDVELGYVGGSTGVYRTRSLQLSAGGHLVKVPGADGSATTAVYLVKLS
ncbi:hypothetical protein ACFC19_39685, partial [Streptomyces sp. NPDC056127]